MYFVSRVICALLIFQVSRKLYYFSSIFQRQKIHFRAGTLCFGNKRHTGYMICWARYTHSGSRFVCQKKKKTKMLKETDEKTKRDIQLGTSSLLCALHAHSAHDVACTPGWASPIQNWKQSEWLRWSGREKAADVSLTIHSNELPPSLDASGLHAGFVCSTQIPVYGLVVFIGA